MLPYRERYECLKERPTFPSPVEPHPAGFPQPDWSAFLHVCNRELILYKTALFPNQVHLLNYGRFWRKPLDSALNTWTPRVLYVHLKDWKKHILQTGMQEWLRISIFTLQFLRNQNLFMVVWSLASPRTKTTMIIRRNVSLLMEAQCITLL